MDSGFPPRVVFCCSRLLRPRIAEIPVRGGAARTHSGFSAGTDGQEIAAVYILFVSHAPSTRSLLLIDRVYFREDLFTPRRAALCLLRWPMQENFGMGLLPNTGKFWHGAVGQRRKTNGSVFQRAR